MVDTERGWAVREREEGKEQRTKKKTQRKRQYCCGELTTGLFGFLGIILSYKFKSNYELFVNN